MGLFALLGILAVRVHVVMFGRYRCRARASAHQTFICCVCVCVCMRACVRARAHARLCVSRGSVGRPRPYVYDVGLHLPQGAPACVGYDHS